MLRTVLLVEAAILAVLAVAVATRMLAASADDPAQAQEPAENHAPSPAPPAPGPSGLAPAPPAATGMIEFAPADRPQPSPALTGRPLPALRDPRVVVSKSAARLTVYDGQKAVKVYRVAVGADTGDKVREGDMRTPEGTFYLCVKKKEPDTPYYRSMGLSYPNAEDAARGLRDGFLTQAQHDAILHALRRKAQPPWDTPLGGAIMIHGCRDGRTGTLGCIALDNPDADELYRHLPLGTEVIVQP